MSREAELHETVHRLQWEIRNAFELGYRAAKPDRGVSKMNPDKGEWFDHWVISKPRATLVNMGVISGQDTFR